MIFVKTISCTVFNTVLAFVDALLEKKISDPVFPPTEEGIRKLTKFKTQFLKFARIEFSDQNQSFVTLKLTSESVSVFFFLVGYIYSSSVEILSTTKYTDELLARQQERSDINAKKLAS